MVTRKPSLTAAIRKHSATVRRFDMSAHLAATAKPVIHVGDGRYPTCKNAACARCAKQ